MKSKESKICDEVARIYDWLDSNIKHFNSHCTACGKCCCFESFGHKLFVTTPELLYFRQNVKNPKSMLTQQCPYLENGKPPHQFTLRRISLKEHLKPLGLTFKTLHRSANWCGGKCSVRNFRFAGCRIFFCKSVRGCLTAADKDLQHRLSEETVKKIKILCDKFDFPYRYIDLMTALNNPELARTL